MCYSSWKTQKKHHNCGYYPVLIFGDVCPGQNQAGLFIAPILTFFQVSSCALLYNIINEHKNVPNWPDKTSIITWNIYLFELKYYNYGEHIDQYGYQSLQTPHSYVDDGEDVVAVVLKLGCSIVTSDRDYGHVPWNHAQWRLLVGFVSISEYMKISQHTTKILMWHNKGIPKCYPVLERSRFKMWFSIRTE